MSYNVNRRVTLLLLLLVTGCLSEEERLQKARANFDNSKTELQKNRQEIYNYSKRLAGDSLYYQVSKNMNDSVKVWTENHLSYYRYMKRDSTGTKEYQIDSIICFNKSRDKCIAAIIMQQKLEAGVQDDIWYFCGVRINGKWYFFSGGTLVLPREYYQKDIHTPLSFETLKLIAAKEVYSSYLKKNKDGKYEINNRFFENMATKNMNAPGYGSCFECKTEEEYYLNLVNLNRSKRNAD